MDNTNQKKEFLIVFTDGHLSYSPSTLNLFFELSKQYSVELIAPKPPIDSYQHQIQHPAINYMDFTLSENIFIRLIKFCRKIYEKIVPASEKVLALRSLNDYRTKFLIKYLKNTNKEIIAVDFIALWCAEKASKKAHLLSLELKDFNYFEHIRYDTIKSVLIQSTERLNFLFKEKKPGYFIVQNAPKNIPFTPNYIKREKTDLIFCGTAVLWFGIITCLDFIKDFKEYTLTIKGAVPGDTMSVIEEFYGSLIQENRLIIDTKYLSEKDLTHYVSQFRIGLAFYDLYRFSHIKTFNYYTAPSGKVFQYLNSGLPVIANRLPAFKFIEDQKCGLLVDHLSSLQIKLAIDQIENDYIGFAKNSKKISAENDFRNMIEPFLDYLNN